MAQAWTESQFRRHIQCLCEQDFEQYCKSLDPNVVIRYPGLPVVIGRQAWLDVCGEFRAWGLENMDVLWFVGGPGKHAAVLKSWIQSKIDAPQVLTFFNVRKGDQFTHTFGAFV
jgi:hypothetical protein